MLRPVGEPHPEGSGVSRFALLDTRGPDPLALLLSAESSTLLPQAAGPVTASLRCLAVHATPARLTPSQLLDQRMTD